VEVWLQAVTRQIILYSLPVIVSLSIVGGIEALRRPREERPKQAFFALAWKGAWLPLAVSLIMQRGVIIGLPRPVMPGPGPATTRLLVHVLLTGVGWLLYTWALGHQAPTGLPPLHFWWAKVLMYFNLCMAFLHILPLPGMLAGEALFSRWPHKQPLSWLAAYPVIWFTLLAASPLLDAGLGAYMIYPAYEYLASLATHL